MSMSSESSSLLFSRSSRSPQEAKPGWKESCHYFLFHSYLNVLLIFAPLSVAAHHCDWDAAAQFSFSFISIIPLAKLIGEATDQLSSKLGQTLAGLLNASFGNAIEIIIGVAALLQGEFRIVQTSMLGSVLSNLLLVMGCSFIAAGFKREESEFKVTGTQASASLMTLSCITLVIPAAYRNTESGTGDQAGLLAISRGTAILLLGVYVVYLVFQLNTHRHLFEPGSIESQQPNDNGELEEEKAKMSAVAAATGLFAVTVVTAFCAEYLVASIESTATRYAIPKAFIGLILLPIVGNAAEHVSAIIMAMKNQMSASIAISVGSSIQIAVFVVPLMVIIGWIAEKEFTLFFANFETIVLAASVLLVNTLIQDGKSNYMEGVMLVTLYLVISIAVWVSG